MFVGLAFVFAVFRQLDFLYETVHPRTAHRTQVLEHEANQHATLLEFALSEQSEQNVVGYSTTACPRQKSNVAFDSWKVPDILVSSHLTLI